MVLLKSAKPWKFSLVNLSMFTVFHEIPILMVWHLKTNQACSNHLTNTQYINAVIYKLLATWLYTLLISHLLDINMFKWLFRCSCINFRPIIERGWMRWEVGLWCGGVGLCIGVGWVGLGEKWQKLSWRHCLSSYESKKHKLEAHTSLGA